MDSYRTSLVSIITPTYNSANYILETYRSIANQSHECWEWLITDDCSTDNTISILEDLVMRDKRITVLKNPTNSGAAVSRNLSIANASGVFVAFIDSDDIWMPDKLERQIDFMGAEIDFSFTAYEIIDNVGGSIGKIVDKQRVRFFTYEDMLCKAATLGCSTVMLRRSQFANLKMPLVRTGQDYALWLKILKSGKNAYLLPEALTHYRITPNSISRNKLKKAKRQWEIYRKLEGLSFVKSFRCFLFYAVRAVIR